jgi:mRNA interferase HigB
MGIRYDLPMQIVAHRTLRLFWEKVPSAETPLRVWYAFASKAEWAGPADIKRQFGASVDFIGDNRVIFDLGGNKYRLILHVAYAYKRALVKFIGTHAEYDKIKAETV